MSPRAVLSTLAILVALGCSGGTPAGRFTGSTFARGADERFHVIAPPPPWERLEQPAGDLAWYHPPSRAIIAANATCRGHADPPLRVLMNDLLMGTTQRQILLDEETTLDGRAALHLVAAVRLDGVPLVYDLYVTKKDGCVYDLALVAPLESYEAVADFYVGFVARFRGKGGRLE